MRFLVRFLLFIFIFFNDNDGLLLQCLYRRVMLVMMYGNVLTSGARESRGGGAAREKPERSQGSSTEWRAGEDEQEMKRTSEQGRCWRPGMRPMRSHRWFVGWFG